MEFLQAICAPAQAVESEHVRYGTTATSRIAGTTLTTDHRRRTPVQVAAEKAGQLHALLRVANQCNPLPAHLALDSATRDNLLTLAERLANELALLTEMEA